MRTKYCSVFFTLLLSALCTTSLETLAQAVPGASDSVSAIFTNFIQKSSDKSIVMLTNRNIFLTDEKIWFKVYVVNTNNGRLDLTFKNLFADLVNEKDSVIDQLVLDNAGMRTNGAFTIPALIPTGFYWIRSYTSEQLENNASNIFLQPVYILNKQLRDESSYARQLSKSLTNHHADPSIHFFAERLTAIPQIISTGVVEIKDGYNNPLSVKGELINSKDSVITRFTTNSFGLARITYVNDTAENYTAVFHINNDVAKYRLPQADKTSIQLSVINQTAKTIKAFVTLEESVPANMHTTILAVHQDSLYYAAVGLGNYGITIPIDNIPGGTVRLLLFDENRNLVSERKIYIPKDNADLEIKTGKKKYGEREDVNVHVKVTDADGKPLASLLNVAVEDEWLQQVSDSVEANMLPPASDFLLDNWLSRFHTKYTDDDIDLLMATRSTVQPLNTTALYKDTQRYDDNTTLQHLTGKIVNRKGNGISDRIITAIASNSMEYFLDVDTTGKDGSFDLLIPQGFDSLRFSLRVTDKRHVQMVEDSIKINSFQYPTFSTPSWSKQQFLANNINTLALLRQYHIDTTITFQGKGWLKPVTVTTAKKEDLNYDASRRITSISQILASDKFRYGGYNALGNAILTVPGVTLSFGDISIFGPDINMQGNIMRPLILMDGSVFPLLHGEKIIDVLNTLNPADIDFIEVLRGAEAASYGIRGGAGVISINTRHGAERISYNNNFPGFTPVTYHVCPHFEMPDYSDKATKNGVNPDPRTTIFWNGNIRTDANGEANINFFTADNATNYTITVTGLTEKGEFINKHITIANTGKSR